MQLFNVAASGAGLDGNQASPGAVPKHDGVPNLLKYAFNMNLGSPDLRRLVPTSGTAGLPSIFLHGSGPARVLKVEYLRRIGSGLNYQPKWSTSLLPGTFVAMTGTAFVTPINNLWERVEIQQPVPSATIQRAFGIVEVSIP